MCGIVGAVAQRNIVPVLIEGLRRLEYRGYDSCGVAVLANGEPRRARSVARVADLDDQVRESHLEGITGIAHTRWATHGAPVTDNAHPIFSRNSLALVHNGIIENYETLREMLRGKGYEFVSQTDTEVIAHLVHSLYQGDVFVGSDTQLVAPVRVGRGVTIAAGTTVWKDVAENVLVLNDKTQTSKSGFVRPTKKKS